MILEQQRAQSTSWLPDAVSLTWYLKRNSLACHHCHTLSLTSDTLNQTLERAQESSTWELHCRVVDEAGAAGG